VSISHHPFPYFAPKPPFYAKRSNLNNKPISDATVCESPKFLRLIGHRGSGTRWCRAVLVDGPSFPLLCVARTDLGMPMDAILVTIQGSER